MNYITLQTIGYWLAAAFMLGGVCAIWWLTEKVENLQRENEELRRLVEIADDHAKIMQDYEAPYRKSPTADPKPVRIYTTSKTNMRKLTCEN